MQIWEILQEVEGGLRELVGSNRSYLRALASYFTTYNDDGEPNGLFKEGDEATAFKTNDVCTWGRHRGPTGADFRGTWTERSLGLSVEVRHDGVFRNPRGLRGCGTRSCDFAVEENRLRTDGQ